MLSHFLPQIFMGAAQRRAARRGVPIYCWHSLGPPPAGARDPFLYVSAADFDRQLALLKEHGFQSATLSAETKPNTAILTFDDGCRNVLRHGLEPLARHGMKAIQFIVAGLIGGKNDWDVKHGEAPEPLMDTAELRDWLAAGHEIGSHTLSHRNLANRTEPEAREQIFASKKLLEDTFQIAIRHFCYPHGRWTSRVAELVAEAGYETACTTKFGVSTSTSPRHLLPRIFPLFTRDLAGKVMHRLLR